MDFALPPRCATCGEIVERVGQFCGPCWGGLAWLGEGCERCGQPLMPGEKARCTPCDVGKAGALDRRRAACGYGDASRRIAIGLKYGRKVGHAKIMAEAMREKLDDALGEGRTLLTPVPLHRMRIWERGFNQSMLVARAMARGRKAEVELVPDLLVRTRRTKPLKSMSHAERRWEVDGAFALNPRWLDRVRGREVILIDDVVTSGGTAEACAKALKKAGARRVELIAWAMVVHPDRLVR